MEILKVIIVSVICSVIYVTVRQLKPEFSPLVQMSSIIVVVSLAGVQLKEIIDQLTDFVSESPIVEDGFILILLKILGISLVTKISSDICKDNGNSALSTSVELAGKIIMLAMSFVFIKTIVDLAKGLLR